MCYSGTCRFEIGAGGYTQGCCGVFKETEAYFKYVYGYVPKCPNYDLEGFEKTVYSVLRNRVETVNDDIARQKNGVVNSNRSKVDD